MFEGLSKKLFAEIRERDQENKTYRVVGRSSRDLWSWSGGSIFASMQSILENMISAADYMENGTTIAFTNRWI